MDDLISRQAAIEYLQRIIDATNTDGKYNLGFIDGLEFCINHLSTMPSEQLERKKGKWILCENPIYSSFRTVAADPYLCTVCNMKNDKQTKYCPNCGAEMEE